MKKIKEFNDRLSAIEWIANNTDNEGQFEVLREELYFNFIYTNENFINIDKQPKEVVLLKEIILDRNNAL